MEVLIWTLFCLLLGGFFVYQLTQKLRLLKTNRTDDNRDYSPKHLIQRLKNTFIYAFAQKKFFVGEQPAGWMHVVVFWAFLVLGIQVITMFARGWFPEFIVPGFSHHMLGGIYGLFKDFFEGVVIIVAAIAILRWTVIKPERLMGFLPAESKLRQQSHTEAVLILIFISGIMWSGLLYDAARISYINTEAILVEKKWQPLSAWLSQWVPVTTGPLVESVSWWVHNLIILVFMNLLPRSKHFHIITAFPNIFFGKTEPKGKLPKKDFESEDALFGRSQIDHFTQKQVLDMYTCTECGRCSSVCPATASGKVLAPRQFLLNLRDELYRNQENLIKASDSNAALDVIIGDGKVIDDEVVWSCNACRACEEACPVNIEYIDKIVDIRQHLVQEASRFPEELNRTFKGLENQSNPWGIGADERFAWAENHEVPTLETNPNPEYLYYVGCGSAFDANNKNNTQSFVKILNKANVSYAVLGNKELCNGETARRLGNEYLYQSLAEMLVETINGAGIKKILVNCPHCFNTFKNEYPDFGGNWEIIRAADLVNQLLKSDQLEMNKTWNKNVVYHDSCYYGRFNDVYEEPRDILKQVPGVTLKEMSQSKNQAKCCGAGGGRMWVEEEKDQRVNMDRADQALEQKPDVVATSCPFCKIMIGSALNEKGAHEVKVMDMMEIVAEQISDEKPSEPSA